jgi:hypothetical protein
MTIQRPPSLLNGKTRLPTRFQRRYALPATQNRDDGDELRGSDSGSEDGVGEETVQAELEKLGGLFGLEFGLESECLGRERG